MVSVCPAIKKVFRPVKPDRPLPDMFDYFFMNGREKSKLKPGVNGMPCFELCHSSGARLEIYLHGAQAVTWRDDGGRPHLFMSKKTFFKPDSPIRGGIPIVFPQFGDGPLPKHGFARIQEWMLLGAKVMASDPVARHGPPTTLRIAMRAGVARDYSADFQNCRTSCGATINNDYVEAAFELKDNEETIKLWPHKFRLELLFRLGAKDLEILFSVQNTGRSEFEFKNGLHTYFAVADISRVSVAGLAGAKFIDYVGEKTEKNETRARIKFERETDRVYPSAPDTIIMEDGGNRRKMVIEKQNMNDVVIWNPWVEKSKRMEDFGDEEYKNMVCVETGNLYKPVCLAPGATHGSMTRFMPGRI